LRWQYKFNPAHVPGRVFVYDGQITRRKLLQFGAPSRVRDFNAQNAGGKI